MRLGVKGLALCVLMLGLGSALAHQGHFSVTDLGFSEVDGVTLLKMRVTYEAHDAPLKLSAALVDGDAAVLERRQNDSYRPAEYLTVGPGVSVFDAASPLRVRLPDELRLNRPQARAVTLLFEPGFLVNASVASGVSVWSHALLWWLVGVFGVVGVLVVAWRLVTNRLLKATPTRKGL